MGKAPMKHILNPGYKIQLLKISASFLTTFFHIYYVSILLSFTHAVPNNIIHWGNNLSYVLCLTLIHRPPRGAPIWDTGSNTILSMTVFADE